MTERVRIPDKPEVVPTLRRPSPKPAAPAAALLTLQRMAGNRAVTQLVRAAVASPPVIQRDVTVDNNPKKLDFMISRFGTELQTAFVNATEEQVTAAVRLVDAAWRTAYAAGTKKLTKKSAGDALNKRAVLEALGKTGAALTSQASYQILTNALATTFKDEADHIFGMKPSKIAKLPLGVPYALDVLEDKGTIDPEDKTGDARLQDCTNNNIVKTGADTPTTATVLYTLENTTADESLTDNDKSWELHAHVTKAGAVDFAHTKADGAHAFVVTDWFKQNIPESDREWSTPT